MDPDIEPAPIPSLSSGSVGSRFVSQKDIDAANATRDAEWKAAYARLGQEPPPRPQPDVYDGRSLYERLQQQKTMKQEEWDEKMKLSNQFRGIDEEESAFLAAVQSERRQKEREQKLREEEEVAVFKAEQARKASDDVTSTLSGDAKATPAPKPPAKKQVSTNLVKKDQRALLKGVIRKKPQGKEVKKPPEKPKNAGKSAVPLPASASATPNEVDGDRRKRRASLVEDVGSDDDDSSTKKPRIDV